MDIESIRLTETVKKGGCAAKLPAGQLSALLKSINLPSSPHLAVGTDTMDDACLWDLGDGRYLIQTLDFFTPIVDDPAEFGAIAAANALSDVYAMGGEPQIALSILAFPTAHLPFEMLKPLLEGAVKVITEAGAVLAGGHTIDDETLKLGFSVTGFVAKEKAWTNAGAKEGDVLILTKALGTGTITSALKNRKAEKAWIDGAIASMTKLNKVRDLLGDADVHAATDVTGFGLAGHALQMCRASRLKIRFDANSLPMLAGAQDCLEAGVLNKAHHSNALYVKDHVDYRGCSEALRWLTVDPQTSGGLLLVMPRVDADAALGQLKSRFPEAAIIGRFESGEP
ncbi:MAG: selenide, water dikinase SelD, partial [Pseudomonas sp.]